jgi:hypothetical protein
MVLAATNDMPMVVWRMVSRRDLRHLTVGYFFVRTKKSTFSFKYCKMLNLTNTNCLSKKILILNILSTALGSAVPKFIRYHIVLRRAGNTKYLKLG